MPCDLWPKWCWSSCVYIKTDPAALLQCLHSMAIKYIKRSWLHRWTWIGLCVRRSSFSVLEQIRTRQAPCLFPISHVRMQLRGGVVSPLAFFRSASNPLHDCSLLWRLFKRRRYIEFAFSFAFRTWSSFPSKCSALRVYSRGFVNYLFKIVWYSF